MAVSELENLRRAISALEAQRGQLGDQVVDAALAPLRARESTLGSAAFGEQLKLVTVLFADVVGSTDMASRLGAEATRDVLDAYFRRWSASIERHGGVVEKFIGDAVLAVFGLPTAREDDAERAVRAALEMRDRLRQLDGERDGDRQRRLVMRVGINTGEVVVSQLGERAGEDFVVVGDTVNVASRLQAAAPDDGILITRATERHVRGLFATVQLGPLRLKGVAEPVDALLVTATRPGQSRPHRGVDGVPTRMVGRDEELRALRRAALAAARDALPPLWTIVGEAGIGKTRLLEELEATTGTADGRLVLHGAAHLGFEDRPFALVRDVVARLASIQDSDVPDVVEAKLTTALGGALDRRPRTEDVALLGRLLALGAGAEPVPGERPEDAEAMRRRAVALVEDYLRSVVQQTPSLVLLEDLHWADDRSLDLVDRLPEILDGAPTLVVCTARPSLLERRPGWGSTAPRTLLELDALSDDASRALLDGIFRHGAPLPEGLRRVLTATAEGNPFFLEELVNLLVEDGVVVREPGGWAVHEDRLRGWRVPPTLTGVLQARLDGLAPAEHAILQRASVVGRVFWDAAVAALGTDDGSGAGSNPEAQALGSDAHSAGGMVRRHATSTFDGTREYEFSHALVRDVAYASLLRRHRRRYHLLAARWLEEVSGRAGRSDEFGVVIARHYVAAEDAALAAQWFLVAGRSAAARFAHEEALDALSRALDLAPDAGPGWEVTVRLVRAQVHEVRGDRDDQRVELELLHAAAERTGDAGARTTTAVHEAEFAFRTGDYDAALTHARRAERLARDSGDAVALARSSLVQVGTLLRTGDLDGAHGQAEQALATARGADEDAVEADALRHSGLVAYYRGEKAAAKERFAEALLLFAASGDRRGEAMAVNNLGGAAFDLGEYDEAAAHYARSLELSRLIGDRAGEGRALNNLGIVAMTRGRYAEAEERYTDALRLARRIGQRSHETSALDNLGNLATARHQYQRAVDYQLSALAGARAIGDRVSEAHTLTNLARAYLLLGDHETAGSYASAAVELARALEDPQGVCAALVGVSHHRLVAGRPDEARLWGEEALALARRHGLASEEASAQHRLGWAADGMDRPDEAVAWFRLAHHERARLGEEPEAVDSLVGLARAHLAAGDAASAVAAAEQVLGHVTAAGLEGLEQPEEMFWSCSRVLSAAGDPRGSQLALRGRELVERVSEQITDQRLRGTYRALPAQRSLSRSGTSGHPDVGERPDDA